MMALQSTETNNIILNTWPYLGPNFAIPKVPIRLRDLAKNSAVKFSIRLMQLTAYILNEVAAAGCCKLFWFVLVLKHGERNVEGLILHSPGKVNFLLQIYTKFL